MGKRTYQKPAIEEVGSVAKHTLANQVQSVVDQALTAGQPVTGS